MLVFRIAEGRLGGVVVRGYLSLLVRAELLTQRHWNSSPC